MDKTKLAAFGERLKIGGERLKVGGAEMGRKFSGKMKEILHGQSQMAKMVEEATSENLEEPNWGLNLRICNLINSEEFDESESEVVRTIKKKISGKSPIGQRLSLDLLDTCASNCDRVFSEVASEKVLEEMVKMIDNPKTYYGNRQTALRLIEAWGKSVDLNYLPVFKQTFLKLKSREISNELEDGSSAQLLSSLEGDFDENASLPGGYPLPSSGQQATVVGSAPLYGVSVEVKKELLVFTRNSLDIMSSLLNTETKEKAIKDELLISMAEKCKESQPVLQRIIETTTDDESMLFEALNLHDELEQVLTNYAKLELAHTTAAEQVHDDLVSSEQQKVTASGQKEEERNLTDAKNSDVFYERRSAEKKE